MMFCSFQASYIILYKSCGKWEQFQMAKKLKNVHEDTEISTEKFVIVQALVQNRSSLDPSEGVLVLFNGKNVLLTSVAAFLRSLIFLVTSRK